LKWDVRLPGTPETVFVPGTPLFRLPATPDTNFVPGSIFPGAKTPQFAPGNLIFVLPRAKLANIAPGRRQSPKVSTPDLSRCPQFWDICIELAPFHARCPSFWDICNGASYEIRYSVPKMAKIGTDKGFETGVSTKFGQKRRRDSPVGRFHSTDLKRSPPDYTVSGGSRNGRR